jgi:hypothetical protein
MKCGGSGSGREFSSSHSGAVLQWIRNTPIPISRFDSLFDDIPSTTHISATTFPFLEYLQHDNGEETFLFPFTPHPLLYVCVKWNGIPPILHKFICILFYYDIIDSNCLLQTQLTIKDRKEGFRRKSGICILLQAHLSQHSLSLAFTCLGNLLASRVK